MNRFSGGLLLLTLSFGLLALSVACDRKGGGNVAIDLGDTGYRTCGGDCNGGKTEPVDAAGDTFCKQDTKCTENTGCSCRLFVRKAGSTSDADWKLKWELGNPKVKPAGSDQEEKCMCSKKK